jgi:hypothetical protein
MLKLVVKRTVKSGLMGGKKFEIFAKVEGENDFATLFKGCADEFVLAYKSAFAEKSVSVKRSELMRGVKFSTATLNETIELEDRLQLAFDQFKRMVEILHKGDTDLTLT